MGAVLTSEPDLINSLESRIGECYATIALMQIQDTDRLLATQEPVRVTKLCTFNLKRGKTADKVVIHTLLTAALRGPGNLERG